MDLEKTKLACYKLPKSSQIVVFSLILIQCLFVFSSLAQAPNARKPKLIREADAPEDKQSVEEPKPKDPDPFQSAQNIKIGIYYFKEKNYKAAIDRFLEALEYQPDSFPAYEGLAQAYEKHGDIKDAVKTYKTFLEKYPESSKSSEFRQKLNRLEKK
jgi:tetratricopeptide (TPR) repeat protein